MDKRAKSSLILCRQLFYDVKWKKFIFYQNLIFEDKNVKFARFFTKNESKIEKNVIEK